MIDAVVEVCQTGAERFWAFTVTVNTPRETLGQYGPYRSVAAGLVGLYGLGFNILAMHVKPGISREWWGT